jgi:hypothetical protein
MKQMTVDMLPIAIVGEGSRKKKKSLHHRLELGPGTGLGGTWYLSLIPQIPHNQHQHQHKQ